LIPRTKLLLSLPIIAAFVIALVYFQLFSSPVIIAIIFVAWVVVSLMNRKKFANQRARNDGKPGQRAFPIATC
jgi:membrane protein implicated in regulation of membrane protease activity